MSKPALTKINEGRAPVQIKTVFFTEGNPTALLVTSVAGHRTEKILPFDNAQAALSWCQRHGSNLFYTATNIQHG